MIFLVSKRVFLNVVCPLSKKEDLLNANYYIADCASPDRTSDYIGQDMLYDDNGTLYQCNNSEMGSGMIHASKYNVKYGSSTLNPTPYITTFISSTGNMDEIRSKYYAYLMEYMCNVQDQIYINDRKGNGMLFVIYYQEDNIINFGDLIAHYLAENFGEDVTFIDPTYRNYVKGQSLYKGNIVNARYIYKNLSDARMLFGFMQASTNSFGIDEGVHNMNNFLLAFNMDQLIRLYQLLWPDDKLPPNRYTISDMKEIIIGKMLQYAPPHPSNPRLSILEFNPDDY